VKYTSILGVSNHVGEMICQEVITLFQYVVKELKCCVQVESKKVDLLVLGRRGLSGIKKYLVGSTSRYVTENAKCNVLVVRVHLMN
jgi:nucleotide-binding universal stress UspA family protein